MDDRNDAILQIVYRALAVYHASAVCHASVAYHASVVDHALAAYHALEVDHALEAAHHEIRGYDHGPEGRKILAVEALNRKKQFRNKFKNKILKNLP